MKRFLPGIFLGVAVSLLMLGGWLVLGSPSGELPVPSADQVTVTTVYVPEPADVK